MKLIYFIAVTLLVLSPLHSNAQKWKEKLNSIKGGESTDSVVFESQDVVAGKWESGKEYMVRNNDSGIMKPVGKHKVIINKDDSGRVVSIEFKDKTYKVWDPNDSDWASAFSYNHMNNLCFFENSIVKFYMNYSTNKIEGIEYVIGSGMGGPNKVKKRVQEYIDYGLAKMKSDRDEADRKRAEHRAKYSIAKQTVESITIEIISEEGTKLDCGSQFRVGYVVKTKEGNTIKSKSLGGEAYVTDYDVIVIGADKEYVYKDGKQTSFYEYTAKPYCEGYDNKNLVIKVVSTHNSSDKAEKRILTTCKPDPAIIAAREAEKKRQIEEEKRRKEYEKKLAAEERARALAEKNKPKTTSSSKSSSSGSNKLSSTYHGIAQFTEVDTIYYQERHFNSPKNFLGVIKDGNDYILAKIAFGKKDKDNPKVRKYYLSVTRRNRQSQEMSEIDLMVKPNSSNTVECKVHMTGGITSNDSGEPGIIKFIKVPEGYLLVGSQAAVWYNKSLDILHKEVLESSKLTDAGIIADVIPIKGKSNQYAMLTVDSDGTSSVRAVNVMQGKKSTGSFPLSKKVSVINHKSAKLFQVSNNNIMVWYKYSIEGDESKYHIMNVFDASKLWSTSGDITGEKIAESSDYFKNRVPNLGKIFSIWSDDNYVVHMLSNVDDGSDLDVQIKFGTALDDFKLYKTVNPGAAMDGVISLQNSEHMRPFKGGYMFVNLVLGLYDNKKDDWVQSISKSGYAFNYFDKDMNYIRSYVFKTKFDKELHDRRSTYFIPNNIGWYKLDKTFSPERYYFENLSKMDYTTNYPLPEAWMRDIEEFKAANNSIDFASTNDPNKVVIMTNSAIMEVDLRNAEPFMPEGKESTYTYVPPSEDNSSNSSTSSSSSASVSNDGGSSDYITIINDLSPDQQTKYGNVRLVFRGGRTASTSVSRGDHNAITIDCGTKAMFKAVDDNSTKINESLKLIDLEGRCGQTIRLSEVW